jgi:catechol 2,3-dioxygenase-like lactoylglutathione lyase family enzyme
MSHAEEPRKRPQVAVLSRRTLLSGLGLAALLPNVPAFAAEPASPGATTGNEPKAASQLPLKSTGLEHMGTVVPDVTAAGKFYGRLFDPELYKEKDPPLRYYVRLGIGYLALGSRANQPHAFFDHFCALVQDYDGRAMAEQLKAEGLPAGRYGIIPDPDGIGFQLLAAPGGLAKTTEPAGRIVDGEALVRPKRLAQVVLHVADLDRSLQFYRRFFGAESHPKRHGDAPFFQIADTRLVLEAGASAEPARVERIVINVESFDHKAVSRELTKLGAQVASHSRQGLRFSDPFGLQMELRPV